MIKYPPNPYPISFFFPVFTTNTRQKNVRQIHVFFFIVWFVQQKTRRKNIRQTDVQFRFFCPNFTQRKPDEKMSPTSMLYIFFVRFLQQKPEAKKCPPNQCLFFFFFSSDFYNNKKQTNNVKIHKKCRIFLI